MIEWLRDVVCQSLPLGCLASSLLAWRPFVLPYGLPFVCRNGKTMLFAGRFASEVMISWAACRASYPPGRARIQAYSCIKATDQLCNILLCDTLRRGVAGLLRCAGIGIAHVVASLSLPLWL